MLENDNDGYDSNMEDAEDDFPIPPPVPPRPNLPQESHTGSIAIINKCETADAKRLSIFNLHTKENSDRQDIGGTYTKETPEFWFYYTTLVQPESFLLLNLFVCHRKTGSFCIGVPNSNDYTLKNHLYTLPSTLTWYNFRTSQKNENHYVKTFQLSLEQFKLDDEVATITLIMPLEIHVDPPFTLNKEVLEAIKLQHYQGNDFLQQEKTDFIIKSNSGKEYPVHKILVASQSAILRQLMSDNKILCLDTDDNTMDLLLQYIYNGTVKNIEQHNVFKLLETMHKFQLKPLLILIDHLINKDLTVNNAVEMALIAKKYKLDNVRNKVFDYIKNNPEVMNSEGWQRLDDVELTKCIFHYVLTKKVD